MASLTLTLTDSVGLVESGPKRPGIARGDTFNLSDSGRRSVSLKKTDSVPVSDSGRRGAMVRRPDVVAVIDRTAKAGHVTRADSLLIQDSRRALAAKRRVKVDYVSRKRIDAAARTDGSQGVVALARPIDETALEDLCQPTTRGRVPFLLVLDGITDPHNLGAVLRSAECAGVTGIVRISMIDYADPSSMLGMELTVIAAVVLGGTRVTGGMGTLTGTILGVALMTILENSLILLGIPTYWSRAFTGAIIIIGTIGLVTDQVLAFIGQRLFAWRSLRQSRLRSFFVRLFTPYDVPMLPDKPAEAKS